MKTVASDTFYGNGKIGVEIVWGFYGENMVDQITRESPY